MTMFIHRVTKVEDCEFAVNGGVKAVYDTNSMGDLIPVPFEQSGDTVALYKEPVGQLYYRYKKKQ
jgi:hypothetical protein